MYDTDVYKTTRYKVKSQKWYCPNCAALLQAYEDSDGKARVKCPQCKVQMTKHKSSRQFDIIEMRTPANY